MSTPCILVTRPEPDATPTAQTLERRGYHVACLPILNIYPVENYKDIILSINKDDIQTIALTSAHALSGLEALHDVPLAAVGSACAEKARALGFKHIHTAAGNAAALAELVATKFSPDAGTILYPRGRHTAFDLAGALRSRGFTVQEIIAYAARPIVQLPSSMTELLEHGEIHAISVYSARTLHTLEKLARQHHLEEKTRYMNLVCLSAKIAKEATNDLWRKVVHADAPEEAAMLETFKRLYGEPPRITTGS